MALRFLTYIVKPWDELNALLAQRFAFQPELSDVTLRVGSLAVALKHQAEVAGLACAVVDRESTESRVMSDLSDSWKHGSLRDPSRNSILTVGAQFECSPDNKFRFLRNVVTVSHASLGDLDFMVTLREAILYWIRKLQLPITWGPALSEGPAEFHDEAFLFFNPKHQISMSATNLRVVRRNEHGELVSYDPPEMRFAVYEHGKQAT